MENILLDAWRSKKTALLNIYATEEASNNSVANWRAAVFQAAGTKKIDTLIDAAPAEDRPFLIYESMQELSSLSEQNPAVKIFALYLTTTVKEMIQIGQRIQDNIDEKYHCLAVLPYHTAASFSPMALANVVEAYSNAVKRQKTLAEELSQIRQALAPYSVFAQMNTEKDDVFSLVSTAVILFATTSTDEQESDISGWVKNEYPNTLVAVPAIFPEAVVNACVQELYFLLGQSARVQGKTESVGLIDKITVLNTYDIFCQSFIESDFFAECHMPKEISYWALSMAVLVLQERGIAVSSLDKSV